MPKPKLAELLELVCPYQAVPYTGDLMGGLYEENVLALKQKEAYNRALEDAWEKMKLDAVHINEGETWVGLEVDRAKTGSAPPPQSVDLHQGFKGPGYWAWIPKGEDAQVKGVSEAPINRFRPTALPKGNYTVTGAAAEVGDREKDCHQFSPPLPPEDDDVIYQTYTSGTSWGLYSLPSDRTYRQWAIEGW